MYTIFQRLNKTIESALGKILCLLFVVMVIVSFSQVVTRMFEYPLSWSEELARYIAIWLTFLGACYALRFKTMVRVDALLKALTPTQRYYLGIGIHVLTLVFAVFLSYYGYNLAMRVVRQTSPAMFIPMYYVYASAPISGVIMTLFTIEQMVDDMRARLEGRV